MDIQPKIVSLFFIIAFCFINDKEALAEETDYQLMLVGSQLEFCRSTELTHCSPSSVTSFSQALSRDSIKYKFSIKQVNKATATEHWQSGRQTIRYDMAIILQELAKKFGTKVLSYPQLLAVWKSTTVKHNQRQLSGHSLLLSLSEDERLMILDFLELPQLDSFSQRIEEQTIVNDKISPFSNSLFQQIVEQARLKNNQSKPSILIVTAGNRDSFYDVDAYTSLFNQLGADAKWLPIDAALTQLKADKERCMWLENYRGRILNSFDRAKVYEDLLLIQQRFCKQPFLMSNAINAADAIVFVGDSPLKLRASLISGDNKPSLYLSLIKRRVEMNKLFVAAIGAVGRALVSQAHTSPVILSGNSEQAMNLGSINVLEASTKCNRFESCQSQHNLTTYYPGGVGLFDFAVLDTDMSERGNIARLARVVYDMEQQFGLGIDQNTAVMLANPESDTVKVKVIGSQGVVVLNKTKDSQQHSTDDELRQINYSYLTTGDIAEFSNGQMRVTYPQWKKTPASANTAPLSFNNLFFNSNFKLFSQQACLINEPQWSGFAGRKRQYTVTLAKSDSSEFRLGGLKVGNGYQLFCSFTSLLLDITRR
ncbi:hypothetical protein [Psychrobium sp. 1_MG-2023]|uniref:hypothetical protein n=1 Tax=Psychrobium sp. 1_MG-2023 TaxID=3062624 RepID=UPI000C346265|nr:hypothetical protein [Psychrobium sp. 1_MG-2023]MDP2560961.1 hypothetical protein [Psychrobium sp. 1_MG-2023]PKF56033.1 hypothetical protein CW748_11515 [Alteromonadales bacterium alter-6D02]